MHVQQGYIYMFVVPLVVRRVVLVSVVAERVVLVAVVGIPSIDITVHTASYELLAELLD